MMNANNPMTPGVYTVEKNAFPNSVAQVPTAIPAFIGYTEKAVKGGKPITGPVLVGSLAEYAQYFGSAPPFQFPIQLVIQGNDFDVSIYGKKYKIGDAVAGKRYYLYHCLELFYQNGGGPCYIVSVGIYGASPNKDDFLDGLGMLTSIPFPKPTMIVMPDALLLSSTDYYTVQQQALLQCGTLKDRVALLDVFQGNQSNTDAGVIDTFRNAIGNNFLNYGISYYPFLATTIVEATDVTYANVDQTSDGAVKLPDIFPGAKALDSLRTITTDLGIAQALAAPPAVTLDGTTGMPKVATATGGIAYPSWQVFYLAAPGSLSGKMPLVWKATVISMMASTLYSAGNPPSNAKAGTVLQTPDLLTAVQGMMAGTGILASLIARLAPMDAWYAGDRKDPLGVFNTAFLKACNWTAVVDLTKMSDPATNPFTPGDLGKAYNLLNGALDQAFKIFNGSVGQVAGTAQALLNQYNGSLEKNNTDYFNLMGAIAAKASILPPCAAMAGVYTLVDNTRGVWKAPANLNINSVIAPTVTISDDDQASLNVDALAGKSINAIRSFYGRGPAIVWGARTLDGNSQDWRYVNVRRTLIMIEQSVANAAFSLVFEANDRSTWTTCTALISNFLHNLWVAGALQGASADDAYSVAVGLGSTMTADDILDGIMRVQVNVALVHPAEFIIITYEQQMAKS